MPATVRNDYCAALKTTGHASRDLITDFAYLDEVLESIEKSLFIIMPISKWLITVSLGLSDENGP
jgi:hypothetical protein